MLELQRGCFIINVLWITSSYPMIIERMGAILTALNIKLVMKYFEYF